MKPGLRSLSKQLVCHSREIMIVSKALWRVRRTQAFLVSTLLIFQDSSTRLMIDCATATGNVARDVFLQDWRQLCTPGPPSVSTRESSSSSDLLLCCSVVSCGCTKQLSDVIAATPDFASQRSHQTIMCQTLNNEDEGINTRKEAFISHKQPEPLAWLFLRTP